MGRYAVESTRALCRARPDWRVLILSNRADLVVEANAVHRGTRLPTRRSGIRVAWLHGWSWIAARGADEAVWIGTAFTLPVWRRRPTIVTIHDLVPLEHPETYSSRINARYAAAATRWAARRADRIVCGSMDTADRLVGRLGTQPDRVRVVPYGVTGAFRDLRRRERHPPQILFVGTFEPRKGLDVLHAAMMQLNASRPEAIELVVAGGVGWGGDKPLLHERWVRVVDSPDDAQLRELYATAALLVLPSRAEGFGLPVAEALASGCPVVCSDLPAIRGFAGDGPLYVPVGDADALARALAGLLQDPEARDHATRRGRRAVADLRWERVGELLAAEVEALTA